MKSCEDNDKFKERAYGLLSKLDNKFENQESIYFSDVACYALKELDYYYKIKNGKSIYDDLNMFLLTNTIPYYNKFLEKNDPSFYKQNNIEEREKIFLQINRIS